MSYYKSILNCIPPLFVLILVTWSYFSYTVNFCFFILMSTTKRILYIIVYHVLFTMFMWSFFETLLRRHKAIPEEFRLSPAEHAKLVTYPDDEANKILKKLADLRKLQLYTRAPNTKIRYCKQCMLIKPDRTHHCSTCEKCILKMDHHCPWVYNCVGYSNYKQFLLTLLYSIIWCGFYVVTVCEYLGEIWKDFQSNVNKAQVGVGLIIASFSGCLLVILCFYHMSLVCRNETTIESLQDITYVEDNITFDMGTWNNFREVFGDNVCSWLLPIHSGNGNGYEFDVRTLTV